MSKSARGGSLITLLMVGCMVVLTILLVRRESVGIGEVPALAGPLIVVDDWVTVAGSGHSAGPTSAPVVLVVFEDYECPACQYFATVTLPTVLAEFSGQIRVVRRHAPLPYHRFAYASARAVECASDQGRFLEMHDALFGAADSLGIKAFATFAAEAGVPDSLAFAKCNARSDSLPVVDADLRLAMSIGATGTPTVAVNGLLFTSAPSVEALRAEVERVLATVGNK